MAEPCQPCLSVDACNFICSNPDDVAVTTSHLVVTSAPTHGMFVYCTLSEDCHIIDVWLLKTHRRSIFHCSLGSSWLTILQLHYERFALAASGCISPDCFNVQFHGETELPVSPEE